MAPAIRDRVGLCYKDAIIFSLSLTGRNFTDENVKSFDRKKKLCKKVMKEKIVNLNGRQSGTV